MNLAYVVPNVFANGGIQQFARLLHRSLILEFDVELVDWHSMLSLPEKAFLRWCGSRISRCYYEGFGYRRMRTHYSTLFKKILIHFWELECALPFQDIPYVVTCHGREILPAHLIGYRKNLYPKALQHACAIVANSHYTRELVLSVSNVSEDKVVVVHPPVALDHKNICNAGNKSNRIKIGTLSRFTPRKNIPNIVEALDILCSKYNVDFEYYLAGGGVQRRHILRRLGKVAFQWKYLGEISEKAKLTEFYPLLDVFVLPTLDLPDDIEGFGMVYLEANAAGVPVVASKVGGVVDAVKEHVSGLFANPWDPEDIAAKVMMILNDKEMHGNIARQWAANFSVEKAGRSLVHLYRDILKVHEPPSCC